MISQVDTFNNQKSLSEAVSIYDVLQVPDLQTIYTKGLDQPTEQQIKEAILVHNPNVKIEDIIISDISNTGAKVTGDEKLYTDSLVVIYTII